MTSKLTAVLSLLLLLSGCVVIVKEGQSPTVEPLVVTSGDQLLHFHIEVPTSSNTTVEANPVVTIPSRDTTPIRGDGKIVTCPMYVPPSIPGMPEFATSEEIAEMDYIETEALLVEHILVLRQYIAEAIREREAAYLKYLAGCP